MASTRKSRSAEAADPLEDHAAARMAELVGREPTVTAAVSGGMDSIVLLELLRRVAPRCDFTLRALHVNHGLSPHAREWERFCRAHCARRRIPFEAVQVVVAGAGANLEAQARA